MLLFPLVTAVFAVALVVAEWKGIAPMKWIAKPAASLGFTLTAVAAGAPSSSYGLAVLVALAFCFAGDVLLMFESKRAFLAGLASFLAGHLVFTSAFGRRGIDRIWSACALAILAIAAIAVWQWLSPHLRGPMRPAVMAYVLAIVAMVTTAAGTFGARGDWRILAGAVGFFVSDLAVARDRFVHRSRLNRVFGLPLYYAAQILLASSVG